MPKTISEVRLIEKGHLSMGDPGMFLNELEIMISTLSLVIESKLYAGKLIQERFEKDLAFMCAFQKKLTSPLNNDSNRPGPAEDEIPC